MRGGLNSLTNKAIGQSGLLSLQGIQEDRERHSILFYNIPTHTHPHSPTHTHQSIGKSMDVENETERDEYMRHVSYITMKCSMFSSVQRKGKEPGRE